MELPFLFVDLMVVSVVSLGKSSKSILIHFTTSQYQFDWVIHIAESECISTHSNGNQSRQV